MDRRWRSRKDRIISFAKLALKRFQWDRQRFIRSVATINVSSSPRSPPRWSQSIAETVLDSEQINVVDGNTGCSGSEFDFAILSFSSLSSSQKDRSTSSSPKINSLQSMTLEDAFLLMTIFEDTPTRQSHFPTPAFVATVEDGTFDWCLNYDAFTLSRLH